MSVKTCKVAMVNVNKNIDNLERVEIDSLRLRIPFEEVTVINPVLTAKIGSYNADTGEAIDEPTARNWFRSEITNKSTDKLYSYKWDVEKVTLHKGHPRKFLLIQVNSKLLEKRYLQGLTLENSELIYKQLMAQKVAHFSYEDFMQSECTDVDFKKDVINKDFKKAKEILNNMSKSYRQIGKGVKPFNEKDNSGIQWSDRRTATPSNPYLKLYHKGIELTNNKKSIHFYNEFIKPQNYDLSDVIRIEFTIKNKKHFRANEIEYTDLKSLMSLTQDVKNNMLKKVVKHHLLPRVIKPEKPLSDLKPMDMVCYNMLLGLHDNTLMDRDRCVDLATSNINPKSRKSERKRHLYKIWDTYIATQDRVKRDLNVRNLFTALCWE